MSPHGMIAGPGYGSIRVRFAQLYQRAMAEMARSVSHSRSVCDGTAERGQLGSGPGTDGRRQKLGHFCSDRRSRGHFGFNRLGGGGGSHNVASEQRTWPLELFFAGQNQTGRREGRGVLAGPTVRFLAAPAFFSRCVPQCWATAVAEASEEVVG